MNAQIQMSGYIIEMRKTVWATLLLMLVGNMPTAHADQVVIPGYATLTFDNKVKLVKTGCQIVPFKFITDENLARENTVFAVAITPKNSKKSFGFAPWYSRLTYLGEKAPPPMARIGVLQVKVCRFPYLYSPKATKKTPAITTGTHNVVFDASLTDPETGALVGEKIELVRKITFY